LTCTCFLKSERSPCFSDEELLGELKGDLAFSF
jgi:hypothetical protein